MADKNSGSLRRCSLFRLFIATCFLFILPWCFLLRSTGRPQIIDYILSPKNKLSSKLETLRPQNPTTQPHKNPPSKCKTHNKVLKVFMYDLPPEFHFGLFDTWEPDTSSPGGVWPDIRTKIPPYPGGLTLQHSIEYWLTLDLLFSQFSPNLEGHPRAAVRVRNSTEADLVFVPFFSSLSYNLCAKLKPQEKQTAGDKDKLLQEKLVKYLTAQDEWKSSGGVDHIILAHHPNSLAHARNQLWPAIFILSDFGRYPPNVANVYKDVIAPYRHVIRSYFNDTSTFETRQILLYFQGAIYRKDGGFIRQELFYLLRDEKDVHFTFGSGARRDGVLMATEGMHSSKFCLNIAGDTPSSNRLFDAIASHCVPVIVSDEIELPYEDVLDYSQFSIFVRTSDAVKKGYLINLVRGVGREEWTRMWERLKEVERHFEFRYPSSGDDAVQMIWKALARKVPDIRLQVHRSRRFRVAGVGRQVQKEEGEGKKFLVPSNFW